MSELNIEAALPGILYQAPSPEADPFKAVGDAVAVGDTIALIEVMKSFIEIQSEVAGTFLGYSLDAEASVEPGDVICKIEVQ